MPQITFSTENVKSRNAETSFPRVKLENKGDYWRIVCAEKGPTYEWVHNLRKPKVSPVDGAPIMIKRERRNGEEYEDYDLDFVGNPLCLGDPDVLDEVGIDRDHCPVCKESTNKDYIAPPERKFAIHVLKYATKSTKGTEIASPFSVETRVWVLSENRFAKVSQIIGEWGGDPTKVDLILGPCNNVGYQNYEIQAGQRCEMLASQDRTQRAVETYQENHAPNLAPYCGRSTEERWIKQDLEDIEARWNAVRAYEGRTAQGGGSGGGALPQADVSDTLDSSLLDTAPTTAPKAAPQAAAAPAAVPEESVSSGLDSLMGGSEAPAEETPAAQPAAEPESAAQPVAETPAEAPAAEAKPEPAAQPVAAAASGPSFSDLLDQLGK